MRRFAGPWGRRQLSSVSSQNHVKVSRGHPPSMVEVVGVSRRLPPSWLEDSSTLEIQQSRASYDRERRSRLRSGRS